MKKHYEAPEAEIEKFYMGADIFTESLTTGDPGIDDGGNEGEWEF